jgi:transposase-like protein
MSTTFMNTLMSAEADAVCGAPYGEISPERTNVRNGYRRRRDLAVVRSQGCRLRTAATP